jgi:hypothetical protein
MLAMRIESPLRRSSTSVCRPESRSPGERAIRTPVTSSYGIVSDSAPSPFEPSKANARDLSSSRPEWLTSSAFCQVTA